MADNPADAKIKLHRKHEMERSAMTNAHIAEGHDMHRRHHAERGEMHQRHEQELLHEGDYGDLGGKPGSAMKKE